MVPVVDKDQRPLMPCSDKRAEKMINSRKATPFWKRGVFCIRLNVEPSARNLQKIAVGIDPGSKKEGYTVKSNKHTYLNIQADAVTWVKKHISIRREMRKGRRSRNTPYRACRLNRKNQKKKGKLAPSTKARWQWKLRICSWLMKMYPISVFVVEDIKAKSKKNQRKWNVSFLPLMIGKNWFYSELKKLAFVETRPGYETKKFRDNLGLEKSKNKMSNDFSAHCIDSWVLANDIVEGHIKPDNEKMLLVVPLRFHRRQLHVLQPRKGGKRKKYGGTRSLGFKRGSLVSHLKYGITYVGGASKGGISLHSLITGERLHRKVKPQNCKFLTYSSFRVSSLINERTGSKK